MSSSVPVEPKSLTAPITWPFLSALKDGKEPVEVSHSDCNEFPHQCVPISPWWNLKTPSATATALEYSLDTGTYWNLRQWDGRCRSQVCSQSRSTCSAGSNLSSYHNSDLGKLQEVANKAMGPKMGLPPSWTSLISATAYSRPQPTFKVQRPEEGSFLPNHADANGENCPQRVLIISQ